MKIKSIKIHNIGLISDESIEFNKPLMLFYGEIRQGKTTILNAVRWAFGGSFPSDIIKHGEQEGFIEIILDNGSISRSFYRNKEGITVSRPQDIVLNGKICGVKDLKQFLNPFLLNQNHLTDMNDIDRTKFVIDLFNVNTADIDSQIIGKEKEASELRATIKGYGEITLIEVAKPDIEGLISKRKEIQSKINILQESINKENEASKSKYETAKKEALKEIIDYNSMQDKCQQAIDSAKMMLNDIYIKVKGTIFEKCFDIENAKRTLDTLPKPEKKKELIINIPEPIYLNVDDSELVKIDAQINSATIDQVKYDQYLKDKARFDQKEADQGKLKNIETEIRQLRKDRTRKLAEINGKIEGLKADDSGIFYEDTAFNMLSTSQLMKLSSELSTLYPEGFGLELIDHGESLGRSIFEFVKKAEKEEKTILATIVGERPANVPENIGVFVVENGDIK
jgi:DNA repair ATPase RecN